MVHALDANTRNCHGPQACRGNEPCKTDARKSAQPSTDNTDPTTDRQHAKHNCLRNYLLGPFTPHWRGDAKTHQHIKIMRKTETWARADTTRTTRRRNNAMPESTFLQLRNKTAVVVVCRSNGIVGCANTCMTESQRKDTGTTFWQVRRNVIN